MNATKNEDNENMKTNKRYYCYGYGVIWRIPLSVIRTVDLSDEDCSSHITDNSRMHSVRQNYKTGDWPNSKLPYGLYAPKGDDRVGVWMPGVECCSVEDLDDMVSYWREQLTRSDS